MYFRLWSCDNFLCWKSNFEVWHHRNFCLEVSGMPNFADRRYNWYNWYIGLADVRKPHRTHGNFRYFFVVAIFVFFLSSRWYFHIFFQTKLGKFSLLKKCQIQFRFLIFSLFPPSLYQKLSHFVAKCWIQHFCRKCHKKINMRAMRK